MPILDGLELIWGENTTGEHDWYFQREAIMLIRDTFFKSLKEEFLFSVLRLFDVTHASFPNVFGSRLAQITLPKKLNHSCRGPFTTTDDLEGIIARLHMIDEIGPHEELFI